MPFSVSSLPRGNKWDEHVLPPPQRRLAAIVFYASAALYLSPAAIASLAIAGVLR